MAKLVLSCTLALVVSECSSHESVVTTTKTTGDESTVGDTTAGDDSSGATPTTSSTSTSTSTSTSSSTTSGGETTVEPATSSGDVAGSSDDTSGADTSTGEPTCAAELLADGLGGPWAMAREGGWIYFTELNGASIDVVDDGGVWRVPVDGGVPELLVGGNEGTSIAASPTALFWSRVVGATTRADLDGGEPTALDVLGRPLAVDATHLFVASTTAVDRFPLAGGPKQTLAAAASEGWNYAYELAVDDQRVYWTTGKTLESVGKDGSGHLTLATGQKYTGGVASDGEHVFWLDINNPGGCQLRRVPVAGGAVEVLWTAAPDHPSPRLCSPGTAEIALDDEHVYWGGDVVLRVAKAGGAAEVVVDCGVLYLRDLLVDDTHVYWLNFVGVCMQGGDCRTGSLMRAPKPA